MICLIHRFRISNALDSDSPLSPALQRHIDRCSDCKSFHENSLALAKTLTDQAADLDRTDFAPAPLPRILEFASQDTADINTSRPATRYLAAAAALAIVAAAGIVYMATRQEAPNLDYQLTVRAIDDVKAVTRTVAGPFAGRSTPAGLSYAAQRPLRAEIDGLTNQTRSALKFLADCTPVNFPQTNRQVPN